MEAESCASRAVYPVFLRLEGARVVVVGAGPVAASKLEGLLSAGARVTLVAPDIDPRCLMAGVTVEQRAYQQGDLVGARFVVAAAPKEVNRAVATEANSLGIPANVVDDLELATAYLGGVVRRGGVTFAISTGGAAPALAGLLREALDLLLPADLDEWIQLARQQRSQWKDAALDLTARREKLRQALIATAPKGDV
jgi:uroporphyrin-III C-methyltransferase / precorrin-2 dehydrogenase / sirohydrochlorin ferrochelatase